MRRPKASELRALLPNDCAAACSRYGIVPPFALLEDGCTAQAAARLEVVMPVDVLEVGAAAVYMELGIGCYVEVAARTLVAMTKAVVCEQPAGKPGREGEA